MATITTTLNSIAQDLQGIDNTIARLKGIGNDNSVVYEEIIDLIQSSFRKTENEIENARFDLEDLPEGSEKEKALRKLTTIDEDLKMYA